MELLPKDRESIQILIVDDERTLRESCASILTGEGYNVEISGKGDEALQMIRRRRPEIILLDLFLPKISGIDILREAVRLDPSCLVIVMTGNASVDSSIQVLREGAWSYIPKPFSAIHLNILIGRAAHLIMVGRETLQLRENHDAVEHSDQIELLGKSEAFRHVIRTARRVAATDASVFIHGESGTGKELIASSSTRKAGAAARRWFVSTPRRCRRPSWSRRCSAT